MARGATATKTRSATASRSTKGSRKRTARPEILVLLKKDHDNVKRMFREFERSAKDDSERAGQVAEEIFTELKVHTECEERIVYPRLRRLDEEIFHEAEEEHHVVDVLMGELDDLQPDSPTYKAKMLVLRENVEHHIREEESEMFKQIRKLPKDELDQAARAWQAAKGADGSASLISEAQTVRPVVG
jgi:hemerythrin-like domain-containing protein